MKLTSLHLLVFLSVLFVLTQTFYYPKWQKVGTESTLSWDVSGYYMYLPATLIYKDLKHCAFQDSIIDKYGPSPIFDQAFVHEASGNYVMKYSIGQAIIYLPFFLLAHGYASISPAYSADGFSLPYQFGIGYGCIFIAILGLIFLRKTLLLYFEDRTVSLALFGLVLGSNYFNYAAIDGAMTHNSLFTIYAMLLFCTHRFYQSPNIRVALSIGALVGLGALTRPTEVLAALIPVLWGVNLLSLTAIKNRLNFFAEHKVKLGLAIIICGLIGSIQLWYWHYVSGDWIVYSYQDQGFSWLAPHIKDGLLSFQSGWLLYSPFMVFSLLGFIWLYAKDKALFFSLFLFSVLFIYITFAWDIWWYGGSFGQRAMIQAYPVLAFPLAAFFDRFRKMRLSPKLLIGILMLVFIYLSLWFTHQAHRGGMLRAGHMSKAYYLAILGTWTPNTDNLKLLDTNEQFKGKIKNIQEIYSDSTIIELDSTVQQSPHLELPIDTDFDWLRVSANVKLGQKEWDVWYMSQLSVRFKNADGKTVKQRCIRLQRLLNDGEDKRLYIDVKKPKDTFTTVEISISNSNSIKRLYIYNIQVEKIWQE